MTTPLTASLRLAATSTFEELALLFAAPADPAADAPALSAAASVTFDGPAPGRLAVGVSAPLLPAVAANMLGFDSAPDAALQRDALGELANVVCGNVVPSLTGDGAVFRLRAPEAAADDAALGARDGEALAAEARLVLDEGEALVRLYLRASAAAAA